MNKLSKIVVKDVTEKEKLKKMYDWSKGFRKFVCFPLSARFLQNRTSKEIIEFMSRVNSEVLAKVFVLYPHTIREEILLCLSDIIQMSILENMHQYVRSNEFALTECVEAENVIQDVLNDVWPEKFQKYKEMERMEEQIAHRYGRKKYLFSKDIDIQKDKQDIYLTIDVNLESYHVHYNEPSWHNACYGRSLEAYFILLNQCIQKREGAIYLDVKYAHRVPNMTELFKKKCKNQSKNQEIIDEQEYFLLIYRIRNFARLFSWIKLSEKLEAQVQELNDFLKIKNFYSKITGNNLISEKSFPEQIQEKFSNEVAKKNFSYWLFREEGRYRKTCICLSDVADLWWIKNGNLTLLFFEIQSFEKCIEKILLFTGLGIDLFFEKNFIIIETDKLKLGFEVNGYDGMKVCNIQCILYDIASIDAKYKELFSVLNDNYYKDRICFRYLEGALNNEKLLELQEETFGS